jgi:uncharacterized protein
MIPNTEPTSMKAETAKTSQGIHLLAKPIGPTCNLNCEYCFYLEKQVLFDDGEQYRMSDDVLSAYISKYIKAQPTPVVEFVWQGGEPTLMGIDFFKRVIQLQKPFASPKKIVNSLQTNATLLTDKWCLFLKENNFLVGISLDGPRAIHDRYRKGRNGKGSFDSVMRGLKLLQKHCVEYNVMACVARDTAQFPLEVYNFFKNEGVEFIQFTPIMERMPDACSSQYGLSLAAPTVPGIQDEKARVTPWSVIPEEYGDFLIAVYEEWVRKDVGKIFVMNFEWALNSWIGNPSPVCIHAEQCGLSLVVEHNGDVYTCDHYVYPQYRLGNIVSDDITTMVERSPRLGCGSTKSIALPGWCRECEVLTSCRGGCPKHRFATTSDNEPGLQYLCPGYKNFFLHIRKYLRAMTQLLENGMPVSYVMQAIDAPLVIKLDEN